MAGSGQPHMAGRAKECESTIGTHSDEFIRLGQPGQSFRQVKQRDFFKLPSSDATQFIVFYRDNWHGT